MTILARHLPENYRLTAYIFLKISDDKSHSFFFFHNDLNIFESKGFGLSFEQHETFSYFLTVFLYPCKLIPQFSLAHQTNRNTTGGIWPW